MRGTRLRGGRGGGFRPNMSRMSRRSNAGSRMSRRMGRNLKKRI